MRFVVCVMDMDTKSYYCIWLCIVWFCNYLVAGWMAISHWSGDGGVGRAVLYIHRVIVCTIQIRDGLNERKILHLLDYVHKF